MAFEGMDVDQVMQVSAQLQREGDAIIQVINTVNGAISHLPTIWKGHDAIEFEGWWTNQHRPALQNAADAIHGLSQSARNNAQAQSDTSNA